MKRVILIFAAFAAWTATAATPGRTATENYVTQKIAEAFSALPNETDPTVPAWAKAATPPQTMTTNDVCNIVTNETVVATNGFTAWTVTANGSPTDVTPPVWHESEYEGDISRWTGFGWQDTENRYDRNAVLMTYEDLNGITGEYITYTATRAPICTTRNALGLARLVDLPPPGVSAQAVTNTIRALSLGGIWDESLQIWWTPRMRNGSLTYEATTNVNLNAEN